MTAAAFRALCILSLVLALAAAAFARNRIYGDAQILWEDVVRKSPRKTRGLNNLGTVYQGLERHADALRLFQRAIDLSPYTTLDSLGNIGNVYIDMKEYARAEELFSRILSVQSADYLSNIGRGKARYLLGKHRAALADFERAILQRPDVARYHLYRADALLKLGESARARQDIVRSCEMGWQEGCERAAALERDGASGR